MTKLDFGNRASDLGLEVFNYYGLTPAAWEALSTQQREIHYNRNRGDVGEYVYPHEDPALREAFSHDPYFYTAHMLPHTRDGFCECQTCVGKFGIMERGK